MSVNDGHFIYEVDAHFHHLTLPRDWAKWVYGARLWKAQTINEFFFLQYDDYDDL